MFKARFVLYFLTSLVAASPASRWASPESLWVTTLPPSPTTPPAPPSPTTPPQHLPALDGGDARGSAPLHRRLRALAPRPDRRSRPAALGARHAHRQGLREPGAR